MRPTTPRLSLMTAATATCLLLPALAAGCDDEADPSDTRSRDKPLRNDDAAMASDPARKDAGAQHGGDGPDERPLYAIANEIYSADDSITYVNVLTSLDIEEVNPAKAIEYAGGRATIATHDGWLFVAAPESQVVTRFAVSDEGEPSEDGELSFASYGFDSVSLDDWGNTFISATKAYLFNAVDGNTVIWNPTTMEIEGEVDLDGFDLVRDGLELNTSPGVARGDRLYRAVSWIDWEAYEFSREQYLAIVDVESDQLIELVEETRCPALSNRIERDEDDNLYFSNWIWNVGATLVGDAPGSCALRVAAGAERFDAEWSLPYAEIADGREGAMFAHLGRGRGLISVFHDERETIGAETAPDELVSAASWRLWSVDLETRTGEPLAGLDWNTGAISTYHIDGRAFLLVPGEDWALTQIHEVVAGRAQHVFDVNGWSYQFFRIR